MSGERGEGAWFAPKRFGLGAVPVTWQGWLLTLAWAGFAVFWVERYRHHPSLLFGVLIPVTLAFLIVVTQRTAGGLRWRWGGD